MTGRKDYDFQVKRKICNHKFSNVRHGIKQQLCVSQKYPTYVSLGFGLGNGGNKDLTITTYKPKENAKKSVDRINEDMPITWL